MPARRLHLRPLRQHAKGFPVGSVITSRSSLGGEGTPLLAREGLPSPPKPPSPSPARFFMEDATARERRSFPAFTVSRQRRKKTGWLSPAQPLFFMARKATRKRRKTPAFFVFDNISFSLLCGRGNKRSVNVPMPRSPISQNAPAGGRRKKESGGIAAAPHLPY